MTHIGTLSVRLKQAVCLARTSLFLLHFNKIGGCPVGQKPDILSVNPLNRREPASGFISPRRSPVCKRFSPLFRSEIFGFSGSTGLRGNIFGKSCRANFEESGNASVFVSNCVELLRGGVRVLTNSIVGIGGPPFARPVRHFELDCLTSKKGQLRYFRSEGRVPEHPPSTL